MIIEYIESGCSVSVITAQEKVEQMVFGSIYTLTAVQFVHNLYKEHFLNEQQFMAIMDYWASCDYCDMSVDCICELEYLLVTYKKNDWDTRCHIYYLR